jgi:hypothetical protein
LQSVYFRPIVPIFIKPCSLSCEPVKASESASVAVIKGQRNWLADRTGDLR